MLEDHYGLAVSTTSAAARDAYVQGCDLYLSMYPGALAAFDQAIAADPNFALAFAGKARVQQLRGDLAARESMTAASAVASELPPRVASHLAFFGSLWPARPRRLWPHCGCTSTSANGLIGSSGRVEQKRELLALLDGLAASYGDDWWFTGHHAFALAENGPHEAARTKID
jgi:hypothetical protein